MPFVPMLGREPFDSSNNGDIDKQRSGFALERRAVVAIPRRGRSTNNLELLLRGRTRSWRHRADSEFDR